MVDASDVEQSEGVDAGDRLTVMVVDDDEDLLVVIAHLLHSEGYSTVTCRDAAHALERLRQKPCPDIIVLDLLMPKLNGWQFRIEQKKDPRWADIPVIALSGDLSPQAEAVDATAYLTKPLDEPTFLRTLRNIATELQRRRQVARASEVQRLVSLGTLVGGIAHEINNPLTFVSGNLDALQRQLDGLRATAGCDPAEMATALHALERVRTGIDRIAAVVNTVSMFAFGDSAVLETVDVHEVLEASLQVAANELRHCARLERAYAAAPRVRANRASLGQVFVNLLLNAVFAIREHELTGHVVRVESRTSGEHVAITIADSASTLEPGVGARIFDPLTSDSTAGRMGLRFGLAISRELVEAMGGSIELQANEPAGTIFRVLLPSCGRISYPPPTPAAEPVVSESSQRPRVMVIDDEPLVCELLEALLSDEYDVTSFTAPLDALSVLLHHPFDVVLCDVMMPELDGLALFERASSARADLLGRFVFITGGAFTDRARSALRATDRPVLRKPCRRSDLVEAVEATLKRVPRAPGGSPIA